MLYLLLTLGFVTVLTLSFDLLAMIFPEQKKAGYEPEVVDSVSE